VSEVSLDLVYDTVHGGSAKLRHVFPPTFSLRHFHRVLYSFVTRMSGQAVTFGADFQKFLSLVDPTISNCSPQPIIAVWQFVSTHFGFAFPGRPGIHEHRR
jgi:hypothetical protein